MIPGNAFESRDAAGTVHHPLGRGAVGLLAYDARGNMSVTHHVRGAQFPPSWCGSAYRDPCRRCYI